MDDTLKVLLVDDEDIVHESIGDYLSDLGLHVTHAYDGFEAVKLLRKNAYDLAFIDLQMPQKDGLSVLKKASEIQPDIGSVIITAHGNMEAAITALRQGAIDFLLKPIKLLDIDGIIEKALRIQQLIRDRQHLKTTIKKIQAADEMCKRTQRFIGDSSATYIVREQIREAAEAECDTILITGETGTGKEVVAREIHSHLYSEEKPFIAVSCPALPDSLVESEFFGNIKGAFTGAMSDRPGYFELADGGTLFLDEVGDLSSSAQAALLRVLETRAFRRVGGSQEIQVKVCLIAATNVSLEKSLKKGTFRADLFYRLNLYRIHLFPLRDRREDIIPLAEFFLENYSSTRGRPYRGLSKSTKKILFTYDFPGNARQLRNIIERAAILSHGNEILPEHLRLDSSNDNKVTLFKTEKFEDDERQLIMEALNAAKWNRREAAKQIGIPYSTLRYKIKSLNIDTDSKTDDD
jgi:two-component system response regulator AtoC